MFLELLILLAATCTATLAQTLNASNESYVLPMGDPAPGDRRQQLIRNKQGYVYGPPILGNGPFLLDGSLGNALLAEEVGLVSQEQEIFAGIVMLETEEAATEVVDVLTKASNATNQTLQAPGTLQEELAPYFELIINQFQTSVPTGIDPGASTNFTQDLYFSMERLSINPFALSRINPNKTLPFSLDDNTTVAVTGTTLANLHQAGRLFVVDHASLAGLPRQPGRFAASSTALFYMHPNTEEFLPLAIKTNEGGDLIYTPRDAPNDWFLAKTLFESNDAVTSSMFHVSATHFVAQIVQQAALRTMADQHPIRGFLDQIMYRAYGVFAVGSTVIFGPGALFDQNYVFNSSVALGWNNQLYHNSSGHFQANYFDRYFVDQCLVNCSYGPELQHFPFYEEALPLVNAIRSFTEAYVQSYYPTDDLFAQDYELQAWIVEANGPAQVLDFPSAPLTSRATLVDILTQMAYLIGVMHPALNEGSLSTSWYVPLHPVAHYQPLPTSKGIQSVLPFLPNLAEALNQNALFAFFSRPNYKYEGLDLPAMFSSPGFLNRANNDTQAATAQFQSTLAELSAANHAKRFDGDGLSQGMPFIWRSLDPIRASFFLDV